MFFWLKGVILTTLRGHPGGSLGPLGAPGAQTMAVNVKFAGLFKLMCPIDGPCRSESESTFNLKIPAVFLEKSTFKKNVTLVKNLSRKIFPLKFFIVSNERGGRKK